MEQQLEEFVERFVTVGSADRAFYNGETKTESRRVKCSAAYIFRHVSSGKIYVGSTSDLQRRKRTHERQLRNGNHHTKKFQKLFNADPNFDFSVILTRTPEEAIAIEQEIIDRYLPAGILLNSTFNAYITGLGHTVSEEHREKLRKLRTGFKVSEETKRIQSTIMKKVMANPEIREKLREKSKAYFENPLNREKISKTHLGRIHTVESKKRMLEGRLGSLRKISVDGTIFNHAKEVSRFFNISYSAVLNRCISKSPSFEGWQYVE